MTEYLAVTSFSQKGFEIYGRESLRSFVRYWPGQIVVYYENAKPEFPTNDKIIWRNLYDDQECVQVLSWARKSPALAGIMPDGSYNYNNDLYKFCRKVFAVTDAAKTEAGLMFWLDADVRLHKAVSHRFLRELLSGVFTCHMGRQQYHSECSFVGYDLRHEIAEKFMKHFRWVYTDGGIMSLRGFHDCWAYDYCISKMNAPAINLSPGGKLTEDVMPTTKLAKYMTHLKGASKYEAA